MSNHKINLTDHEIIALKATLNYKTRDEQLDDNYSNGGMKVMMAALKWNKHQVAALTGSLEKKGCGVWDEEGADIFWLTDDGINAIFDVIEAEQARTEKSGQPEPEAEPAAVAEARAAYRAQHDRNEQLFTDFKALEDKGAEMQKLIDENGRKTVDAWNVYFAGQQELRRLEKTLRSAETDELAAALEEDFGERSAIIEIGDVSTMKPVPVPARSEVPEFEGRTRAVERLAEYGYTLGDRNLIYKPSGEPTRVRLNFTKTRVQARHSSGNELIWSGTDIGAFLEAFWFAKKL